MLAQNLSSDFLRKYYLEGELKFYVHMLSAEQDSSRKEALKAAIKNMEKSLSGYPRAKHTSTLDVWLPGSFQVTGKRLFIGDPTYPVTSRWVALRNVVPGTWSSFVRLGHCSGTRVFELVAAHESVVQYLPMSVYNLFDDPENFAWKLSRTVIGVDAGSVGIFCLPSFKKEFSELDDLSSEIILHATGTPIVQAANLDNGVLASSGMGDGGYSLRTTSNVDGRVDVARVTFIRQVDHES